MDSTALALLVDLARMRRAVETERARLEAVVRQMPVGVIITQAPTGKVVLYNEEAERILGHSLLPANLGSYAVYRGFHCDGRPYQADEYPVARSLMRDEVVQGEEIVYLRGDGVRIVISVSSTPIHDREGCTIAAVATFYDISERKQAEAHLRQAHTELETRVAERTAELVRANAALQAEIAERKQVQAQCEQLLQDVERRAAELNAVIESSKDCIKVLDAAGRLLFMSRWGQRLLEIADIAPYLNRPWVNFWRGESKRRAHEAVRAAQAGGTGAFEGFSQTRRGTPKWWDVVIAPITDAEGRVERLLCVSRDITERKRAEAAREDLVRRLVAAQEAECRHIARELHDEIGQALTGIKFVLEMAGRGDTAQQHARIHEAHTIVNDLMACVSEMSLDLRPSILDDLGLLPALLWHVERYTKQTGVQVDLRHRGLERRFAAELETVVFRIVQEALTNIARHAGVSQATVQLLAERMLIVRIQDHGAGFDPEASHAHTSGGLSGMRERVTLVGGTLTVEATPGKGTCILAELPLSVSNKRLG